MANFMQFIYADIILDARMLFGCNETLQLCYKICDTICSLF